MQCPREHRWTGVDREKPALGAHGRQVAGLSSPHLFGAGGRTESRRPPPAGEPALPEVSELPSPTPRTWLPLSGSRCAQPRAWPPPLNPGAVGQAGAFALLSVTRPQPLTEGSDQALGLCRGLGLSCVPSKFTCCSLWYLRCDRIGRQGVKR